MGELPNHNQLEGVDTPIVLPDNPTSHHHTPIPSKAAAREVARQDLIPHLPTAIDRIVQGLGSPTERVAIDCARWLIEMVLGRPSQQLDLKADTESIAAALGHALREALLTVRQQTLPAIEGHLRILGPVAPLYDDFPSEPLP